MYDVNIFSIYFRPITKPAFFKSGILNVLNYFTFYNNIQFFCTEQIDKFSFCLELIIYSIIFIKFSLMAIILK